MSAGHLFVWLPGGDCAVPTGCMRALEDSLLEAVASYRFVARNRALPPDARLSAARAAIACRHAVRQLTSTGAQFPVR